jgi:TRAP-type C4-dicarboxylate transport system permease small subunit
MNTECSDNTRGFLSVFDRALVYSLRLVCVCCFSCLLVLLAGNVFVRYFPVTAFYWFDEVVEWMFAWMVFFGAAALWARDEHFRLEWINKKIRGTPTGHLIAAGLEVISLFFLVIFFYQALRLTILAKDWTPVFNVSKRYLYVCMPAAGFIMVGYSIRNILREMLAFRKLRDREGEGQTQNNTRPRHQDP